MPNQEPMIKVQDVRFRYDPEQPKYAVDGVSLDIRRGEFVAVLGANGCGKSTLAKHFNAILLPEAGTVLVEGMDTRNEDHLYDVRQKVGMVFQNPDNQIVATIVEEDVAFAPENLGVPPEEIRTRIDEAMKLAGIYEKREAAPYKLSGGQKQRVAIAGVIAMRPDCLVMDESTAMLDPHGRAQVMKTIRQLRAAGITIVSITHYMEEAAQADRVLVMSRGRIVMEGTPEQVFSQTERLHGYHLDVPQAAELRDEEEALKKEREEAEKQWEEDTSKTVQNVTVEDIADVVSMSTGVPVSNLTEAETEKLLRMEGVLHERIIGQDEAVTALSKAIRRSRSGLKDPKRPAGSFIFLGPSGVGKTELSKALAEFLFNSEDALLSFDMSEYMEKHTVSRLVGSPPGYVGFDEGGQLTKAVRQRPYSVVLFDEIEKAHPDVFNILLQILEEGRLTDAQGRTVDFRNTVIIMTSNVGARDITTTTTLGFSNSGQNGLSDKEIKSRVMHELKNAFRPEFLNRIDEIIVFKSLTEDEIVQIVDLMVAELRERMIAQNMTINLDDAAKRLVAKEGTDTAFGARPLRRAIQRMLEDPLSEQILEGRWTSGSVVDVTVSEDGEELVFSEGTGSIPAPRKRDSIARDAELLLTNYDLGHAGVGSGRGAGTPAGSLAGGE